MFPLTIAQIDTNLFSGDATSVTVPGREGAMTILKDHTPLVSALKGGNILVRAGDEEHTFEVQQGIISVERERVTILLS